ncbi:TetR/AcrR family transcriptional regulator [Actinokineospora fastidiosa]|uniref:TetR family transcriptional regulator n=1 Tax=Actinokineospora fastidiosa TaxID=1816 RepID=A0A918GQA9_9PSEU|nr:TetR/AcrR family transcriptional regulator [Actinokineospora fastidiosa]GGS49806.1 TetR family transcriptional regulator [Actinokineospora fastidiosa]
MTTSPVRRPRDRKAQLATAAADLFRRHGYHAVGVNDIAAAVGITGPGMYRHFQNKQAVLGHVLLTGVDALAARLNGVLDGFGDPESGLRPLLRAAAEISIDQRDLTALWRWQGRHLHQADQKEIIRRTGVLLGGWQAGLRRLRPELGDRDALLLCFAALSVFGSVGDHHAAPARERFVDLLADLAETAVRSPVVPSTETTAVRPRPAVAASRREELLTAATRLFRDHGFHAVSMEDIGAAAGIAGPSIYRHFAGKSDILLAASRRMADRLTLGLNDSLSEATSPRDALHRLARSYVDTVLRSDDLIAVYANEIGNLPERDAKEMRRLQRAYVAEWVRLLREVSPSLSDAEARVVVQAALTVVNDLPRTRGVNDRPRLATELTALAVGLLDSQA